MKLVPYDKNKIERLNSYKMSENHRLLEEFAKSGLDCALVEGYTTSNAHVCAKSLKNSMKTYGFGGFTAIVRKGKVYLIRED